ncbi:adenosylcobinamide-GDP ribazoletransferase [Novosphingobium sp. KCTC 2891]|uniref:adenosylcobinamide-GDP ribazoletransferase n=1 Tax=Novosphingobium sp. KCTC 2891 TaxID=2989730 RepID=UPI002222C3DE|nr:adenosylcobinamide-GDP ribazoletransferase [Novosphingobium sp. KCTC 2891]MCW1383726.1 adenosylcobinamide-GDP ribazoletransferase [Novosphingobium sp. KCTC 2891]
MKPLLLAVQFMTRLPLPAIAADDDDFGRAIRWFPVAGLLVGGTVAGAAWIGETRDPALGALLGLAAWVCMTGALHLDGLGDIADAAGAAHADRARISEVLADPHLGSFGAVTITLQLLAKFVLLDLFLGDGDAGRPMSMLVLVPVLARIGPLAWTLLLRPLHSGFGTLFRRGANWLVLAGWLAVWAACAAAACPLLLAALPVVPLWALWLRARIGGISGDGHGAGIELVETGALLMLVLAR